MVPEWVRAQGHHGLAVSYIAGDIAYTTYKESQKKDGDPLRAGARDRLSGRRVARAAHVYHSPGGPRRAVRDEENGPVQAGGRRSPGSLSSPRCPTRWTSRASMRSIGRLTAGRPKKGGGGQPGDVEGPEAQMVQAAGQHLVLIARRE